MKIPGGPSFLTVGILILFMFTVPGSGGCVRTSVSEPLAAADAFLPGPAWPALAILKTGEQPLWFEFTREGPRQIPSPAEASLVDFSPWPLSRFSAGLLMSDSDLVFAVNREGFLIISPAEDKSSAVLYRAVDPAAWDPYSIASFFIHEGRPAVLLYRDDFFSSSQARALVNPVFVLDKEQAKPQNPNVPALDQLLKEDGWEATALRQGSDQNWYYRFVRTAGDQREIKYFRSPDLSAEGWEINQGDFWNSAPPDDEPVYLPVTGPITANLNPGGRGSVFADGKEMFFSLPELPAGFVYTAVGTAGNILAASWEEQDESAVGAAGFMVLNANIPGLSPDP